MILPILLPALRRTAGLLLLSAVVVKLRRFLAQIRTARNYARGRAGTPGLGAVPILFETIDQIGKALPQSLREIGIARADGHLHAATAVDQA